MSIDKLILTLGSVMLVVAVIGALIITNAKGSQSHNLCFTYEGKTTCMSPAKVQKLRDDVKSLNKSIDQWNNSPYVVKP